MGACIIFLHFTVDIPFYPSTSSTSSVRAASSYRDLAAYNTITRIYYLWPGIYYLIPASGSGYFVFLSLVFPCYTFVIVFWGICSA